MQLIAHFLQIIQRNGYLLALRTVRLFAAGDADVYFLAGIGCVGKARDYVTGSERTLLAVGDDGQITRDDESPARRIERRKNVVNI